MKKVFLLALLMLMAIWSALHAQESMSGKGGHDMDTSAPDLVKVYVKQDPSALRQTRETQAVQPSGVEFAVQLSASSRPVTDKNLLSGWEEIGPVFVTTENGLYKVRIGPFHTQEGAKEVLLKVKAKGKKDAFIVVQKGRENHVPFVSNNTTPAEDKIGAVEPSVPAEAAVEYKVRLASYLQPGAFSTKDIDHLGTLESYRKGEWTILMFGGIPSMDQARKIKSEVIQKGFPDAKIVIVRDGLLEEAE